MKRIDSIAWTLMFLSLSCAHRKPKPVAAQEPISRDPYPAAYAAGRADAEAELAQGNPVWLRMPTAGKEASGKQPSGKDASGFDAAAGLPWITVDPHDPLSPGRVAGHNETLEAYIQKYGLPESSRAKWAAEITHPRQQFINRAKVTPPDALRVDGRSYHTADGQFALAWHHAAEGSAPTTLELVKNGQSLPIPPLPATRFPGTIQFIWGPDGSDVAYVHWTAPQAPPGQCQGYSTLDLRTGQWLSHEDAGQSL